MINDEAYRAGTNRREPKVTRLRGIGEVTLYRSDKQTGSELPNNSPKTAWGSNTVTKMSRCRSYSVV